MLRLQEKSEKSRETPVRLDLQRDILARLRATRIEGDGRDRTLFCPTVRKTKSRGISLRGLRFRSSPTLLDPASFK